MTKLEELIYALTTVIIRYHDTQLSVTKLVPEAKSMSTLALRKKSKDYAISLLQNKEIHFAHQLKDIIDACTNEHSERAQLLHFLLFEIKFLKEQWDRKIPFNSSELEKYQQQITQLFFDLKQLLLVSKEDYYKVTYSKLCSGIKTRLDLAGMINTAYFGPHFCNSGSMIQEEVLDPFYLTGKSTYEELWEIASNLCMEHQSRLLISDFSEKNITLKLTIDTLQTELEKTKEELQKTQIQYQELLKKYESSTNPTKRVLGFPVTHKNPKNNRPIPTFFNQTKNLLQEKHAENEGLIDYGPPSDKNRKIHELI